VAAFGDRGDAGRQRTRTPAGCSPRTISRI